MRAAQRHPPAFQVEVRAQPLLQGLISGLATLAFLAALAGAAAHHPYAWWLLAATPLPAWLGWRCSRVTSRHLQWDGQTWRLAPITLHEPGPAVAIEVVLDFGHWLLLRAKSRGDRWPRPVYLPLSRSTQGAAWGQLRATLYSARPHDPSLDEPR